jgi:hypothetical protein
MNGASIFGVFHLTPFHNIIHIGVGALWPRCRQSRISPVQQ